jgi:hypothetical protein
VLFGRFFKSRLPNKKIPVELVNTWIKDSLIELCLLIRCTAIQPHDPRQVTQLFESSKNFYLHYSPPNATDINWAGLAHFERNARSFIHDNCDKFETRDVYLLGPCMEAVSQITETNWILYHPLWLKAFGRHPKRLGLFRSFLYAVMMSNFMPDDYLQHALCLSRDDLLSLAHDFVELRSKHHVTGKDIENFLLRLVIHCDMIPQDSLFTIMITSPYSMFQHYHTMYFQSPSSSPDDVEAPTIQGDYANDNG